MGYWQRGNRGTRCPDGPEAPDTHQNPRKGLKAMSQTNMFTEQETKRGMEILQAVLKRLFAAGATPNVSDLPAVSEAVAKACGTG